MLSKPLTILPSYLSAISMVGDDLEYTIRQLTYAERKSPPVYNPARDIFIRVLQGDFDVDRGVTEANRLQDGVERQCAREVLETSRNFLANQPPARVRRLDAMSISLPDGTDLNISPVWIRHLHPQPRLMVLHFWQQALTDWQLSAAGSVLIEALKGHNKNCLGLDLDFVSVAIPDRAASRRLILYDWYKLHPLDSEDLRRFLDRLCAAWAAYQRRERRVIRNRSGPDLFEVDG